MSPSWVLVLALALVARCEDCADSSDWPSNNTRVIPNIVTPEESAWLEQLRHIPHQLEFKTFPLGKSAQGIPFRLFVPEHDAETALPLVLYLNHGGVRSDFDRLLWPYPTGNAYGLGRLLSNSTQEKHPHFVLAPWSGRAGWTTDRLGLALDLIQEIRQTHNIDLDRVYVMGQSLGGIGTFTAIHAFPHVFAAGISICGFTHEKPEPFARTLRDDSAAQNPPRLVPIWAFLGQVDPVIEPIRTRQSVTDHRAGGGWVALWEYEQADHELVSERATIEPQLIPWLFSHRLTTTPA